MEVFWSVAQLEAFLLHHPKNRDRTLAERQLDRAGFETYLPCTKTRRDGCTRIAPLFPGYLFVRVSDHRWRPIFDAIGSGIIRILMAGERPARLPNSAIDEIRHREVRGFVRLPARILPGQHVRVMTGAFRDQVGLYEGQSARERERVLLQMFGQTVRVELHKTDRIEPLAS
jgi:transcriptional antiterminator RfaH